MQALLQAESIRDEAKGSALREQLRSIYEKHIAGKSLEHISLLQVQQVEAVLAIKDAEPDEASSKPRRPGGAKRRKVVGKQ